MGQSALPFDDPPLRRCCTCGNLKLPSDFHRKHDGRDGLQPRCRACNIELNRRWYRDHPEARARRMDAYAKARRAANHRRVLGYLRLHPCVDCGETDPVVLDFDHLRDKTANVSAMLGRPWGRIVTEIEKCEVRCANCHRRRTAREGNWFRHVEASKDAGGARCEPHGPPES